MCAIKLQRTAVRYGGLHALQYEDYISVYMKAAAFVFLLMVCGTVMRAQSSAAPSADVTISISEGTPEYCVGSYGPSVLLPNRDPDDITLRLPLKVSYENHRSETIILPLWSHYLMRMTL